jgi:hypothetical protein
MAEDTLHSRRVELSSNRFRSKYLDEALSGKSIKGCGFTLPLNFNLNATINAAEYIRETNYNHSRLLQIIQDEYRLNPEQKENVHDIILSPINSNEGKIFFRCFWKQG